MKNIKLIKVIASLFIVTSTLTINAVNAEEGVIEIPTISTNLVKNANAKQSNGSSIENTTQTYSSYNDGQSNRVKVSNKKHAEQFPLNIKIKPGVNEIITIARNVGNRIVFPFEHPVVHTFNKSDVKQSGNVIYISTKTKNPVGIFVTDSDDESVAISLTLVPRDIPPREVRLVYGEDHSGYVFNKKKSERWEKEGDFESTVKNLLKKIALRDAPPGYSLVKKFKNDDFLCDHYGVNSQLRQVVQGSNLEVGIRMVENVSTQDIEIYEPGCYKEGVVAVAGWPTSIIKPGEATEIYIVRRIANQQRQYGRASNLKFDY